MTRFARGGFVLLAAMVALTIGACGAGGGSDDAGSPNVVLLLTDDQTLESLRVMNRTNALLGDQGTTFTNAIISYPLCCPARASFLTGQYAHNHGVLENVPPAGGYNALDGDHTLPVWLSRAGYTTSHIGKYLNGYGETAPPVVPPGWDAWFGLQDPSTYGYLSYDVSIDGTLRHYEGPANYQTDVLTDRAVAEIDRMAAGGDPFFLNVWYTAPHGGRDTAVESEAAPVPAPRHRAGFQDEPLPRGAAYNEADVSDKPARIRQLPPLTEADIQEAERTYRAELESLQAVDESVARIVDRLDENGELDNTVIVFMSDNGFLLGEHRIRFQKTVPYEESIRVPMLVRGPGFPAGTEVTEPVMNVDFVPTVLDMAGAEPDLTLDGRSLAPVAEAASTADRPILIEIGPPNRLLDHYEGVRTQRYTYVEYEGGEVELYDLQEDRAQTTNLAGRPEMAEIQAALAATLDELRTCAGESCDVPAPDLDG